MPIESDRREREAEPAAVIAPHDALPSLATALTEEAMKGYMQETLFGAESGYSVERCAPTRPLYVPAEWCMVRYEVVARNHATGDVVDPLVTGRVFPDRAACEAYMDEKLAPLARRMRGRPEVAAFAAPAAVIEPLHMAAHVWPVDGELPTLVDVTDHPRMLELFRELLPSALEPFVVDDCRIERVSYRRRQRCVLRYTVEGRTPGSDARSIVLYGKVTGVGADTLANPAVDALRAHVRRHGDRVVLPRLLAWRPDVGLALLEAVPGEGQIRRSVRRRLRGRPPPGGVPLEEMVATCAHAAALLHTSDVDVGPVRAFADELAALGGEVEAAARFVPGFGERARGWLERIAALGEASPQLGLALGHGDFNHGQFVFDGARGALLDLDTLCRAEPGLDVGKFTAHLRAETEKLRRRYGVSSALGDELADCFLRAYADATVATPADERRLLARAAVYEALALLRLAVRSRHDFEDTRFEIATALLEQRLAAAVSPRRT